MRKFIEKCGFQQESIMRKHRIVDRRNRDTAVYVVLNSDWEQIDVKLKKILGISLRAKVHKVAEIEESSSKNVPKNVPEKKLKVVSTTVFEKVPQKIPQISPQNVLKNANNANNVSRPSSSDVQGVLSGLSVSQKNRLKKKNSKVEKRETI